LAKQKKASKPEARSRGLTATSLTSGRPPAAIESLRQAVVEDGGEPLATYRDPVGGRWQLLAALPIDAVQPTPFQRDLSETHAARLADVIDKLDRFLDPIIAVRAAEGGYWTPTATTASRRCARSAPRPSSRSCSPSPRPPTASSP
jgi:ParB family chromosome partitioning protein